MILGHPIRGPKKVIRMGGFKSVSSPLSRWRSWLRMVPCIMAVYFLIYISIGVEDGKSRPASKMPRDTQEVFYDMRFKNNTEDKGHTHSPGIAKRHPHLIFREHRISQPYISQHHQASLLDSLRPMNMKATENRTKSEQHRLANTQEEFINPHNFRYILNNPYTCQEESIFLLIFVHSSPDHFEDRDVIRKSWASVIQYGEFNIRTIFLLAVPTDRILQWKIEEESQIHEDIIQEDFTDHYRNLTHKHIMGLKWVKDHCSHAQYIIKIDDDTFVNIFRLSDFLDQSFAKQPLENTIYCSVFRNQGPRRDKKDKWYVSEEEYPQEKYPPYCEGFAYVMSPDLVSKLYSASLRTKYYWIDDVYVTGMLTSQIGAKLRSFHDPNGYSIMSTKHWHQDHVNGAIFLLAKYIKETPTWMKIWSATKKYSLKRTITLRRVSELARLNHF